MQQRRPIVHSNQHHPHQSHSPQRSVAGLAPAFTYCGRDRHGARSAATCKRMWDRYDPRSSNDRDRDDVDDRSRGTRGGSSERYHAADRDPRDVFTKDLDLPRGRERRPVRDRDRVYEINGAESRILATVGAFRVVSEGDLHDGREDTRRAARRASLHLAWPGPRQAATFHTSLGEPTRRPGIPASDVRRRP